MKKVSIAILAAVLGSSSARADQCEIVDPAIAHKANAVLMPGVKAVELCRSCGYNAPSDRFVVDRVELRKAEIGGGVAILVNGVPVDLAYLYVQRRGAKYENVAMIVGCEVVGESRHVAVGQRARRGQKKQPSKLAELRPAIEEELIGVWTDGMTTFTIRRMTREDSRTPGATYGKKVTGLVTNVYGGWLPLQRGSFLGTSAEGEVYVAEDSARIGFDFRLRGDKLLVETFMESEGEATRGTGVYRRVRR